MTKDLEAVKPKIMGFEKTTNNFRVPRTILFNR